MKIRILLVVLSVVLMCFASNVSASIISIDIDGLSDNGLVSPGTMTGVAGIGSVGDQWNAYVHYTPGSPSIASDPDMSDYLVDSTGSTKTVRFDVSSCVADSCATANRADNALLDDYVYTTPNNTIAFTLQGLTVGNAYDLYLYGAAGSQSSSTYATTFTVGGTDKTLNNAAVFDGTFVENREYVLFSGLVADGSGTIGGVVSSPTNFYSIFNGVQIVGDFAAVSEVPEPSTIALLITGLFGLAYAWRKLK